ncbi:MAG: acylphosphatase [Pseudomonadota bacterium]
MSGRIARRLSIAGRVQGAGFRYWLRERAAAHGLSGWCRNTPDGRVSAVVAGPSDKVEALLAECRDGPPAASVQEVVTDAAEDPGDTPFEIRR